MKITHNKIGQNINLSDSSKSEKASEKSKLDGVKNQKGASSADALKDLGSMNGTEASKVALSERSQDIRHIKELATASPDIDHAKVEKFQRLIDEGKYKVDARAVADRMIDEQLLSAGASND